MIFNQITIQGFKSVAKPITLDLGVFSVGTCFVTGENQAEPHLGANGVGKSTIWDALCWCLYGKDTKKHKAGNVVNWYSSEQCIVTVEVVLDGEHYEITRTQSPNQILVDGEECVQEQLDDLLGLNYQSFMYLVVIPQFSSKFFDLQPADKLHIFSSILDLEKWLDYSAKAKVKADGIEVDMSNLALDITYLDGQIGQLDSEVLSLVSRGKGWEAQQEEKTRRVRREIHENQASSDLWLDQIEELNINIKSLGSKYDELVDTYKEAEEEYAEYKDSCRVWVDYIIKTEHSIKNFQEDYDLFDKLEGVCPHCEQDITPTYLSKKLKDTSGKIAKMQVILQQHKDALKREELETKKVKDDLDKVSANRLQTLQKFQSLRDSLNKMKSNADNVDNLLSRLESELDGLEHEENPFVGMQEEAKDKIKILKKGRRNKKRDIKKLNIEYNLYIYWIKGFKEVRLFVIEEALLELQLQINNNLEKLGLQDWEINLAVDHVTKSGTIRKGFTVLVKSPHNEELVPFTCYSGGEGQRLKIAGTLGLADFISSRTGINPNIEVWDEATSWMSNEGVRDLVELLADRAEDLNKTIFVVDHRDLNTYGEFTDILHIIKDEEGSKIV